MADGTRRGPPSGWLIGLIVLVVLVIIITWGGSGNWGWYNRSSGAGNSGAPAHTARAPSKGGTVANGGAAAVNPSKPSATAHGGATR